MKLQISSLHSPKRGFTLIELMVVIVIIGILASITVPAATKMIAQAKKTQCANDALQLKSAIGTYFTEYRKYPVKNPQAGNDTPIESKNELMDILLAADGEAGPNGLNPRKISFCSFKKAKPAGNQKYRGGVILDQSGGGTLWDPFTRHYFVKMDLDYNNRINAPSWVEGTSVIPQGVIVWSLGPEEAEDADNIVTW